MYYKKQLNGQPFPYEHFVPVEANRMMGIYRFANYFTNVPQVHGSIKRRPYFDFIYKLVPKTHQQTFSYYLFRSVLRTDDHFYLWLRLVVINGLVVAFVDLPIVSIIVSAALAFAVAIQLKQALGSTHEFTMSMLYPLPQDARKKATIKISRYMILAHAIIVLLCSIMQPYFYVYALVVFLIGELTLRISK
nr:ABC transporter permease [Kurthia senegalensis]